ncbi:MAG: hypothetical protein GPI95_22590 [Microcystis aeruginosa LG13-11]|nr:hypothetical protein [Microcystis aeruginosa LG13-11]
MLPNQVTKSLVPKTAVIGIIAGVGVLAEPVQAAILQAQVGSAEKVFRGGRVWGMGCRV